MTAREPSPRGRSLVLMGEEQVSRIPVQECGEPMVDLAGVPGIAIDNRLADAKGRHRLARSGVASRLADAAATLPSGLQLLVVEAYRPVEMQQRYFDAHLDELRLVYDGLPEQELFLLASRFVAPPVGVPPHCSGAAVDLTLSAEGGSELEMGTGINEGPEQSGGRCFSDSKDISKECGENREVLFQALTAQGLVNYPTEWWHWSFGDRYWALKTGAQAAVYGLIT